MKESDRNRYFEQYQSEYSEYGSNSGSQLNYAPLPSGTAVTPELTRHLFSKNIYPYADRVSFKAYHKLNYPIQIELVKFQNWVKQTKQKIIIIFEGRDAAGKGSTIKRFTEHLNPRGTRVVALDKPTEIERDQWYFQRYVDCLPTGGEIVFFDRSWYNRAGVERVMNFCTEEEYWEFTNQVPAYERMLVRSGIRIFKFYLSVSREEQAFRLKEREQNPLKQWKLSPMDKEAQRKWDAYTEAKEATFNLTDTPEAPWMIVKAEDKLRARIATMQHVLHESDYADKDTTVSIRPDPLILAPASIVFG